MGRGEFNRGRGGRGRGRGGHDQRGGRRPPFNKNYQGKQFYKKYKFEGKYDKYIEKNEDGSVKDPRAQRIPFPKPENREMLSGKEWVTKERLHEDKVGIHCYITESEGFTALMKLRYSDFHVNEIDAKGKEAVLNNLNVPKPPNPCYLTEEQKQQVRTDFDLNDEVLQKIQTIADAEETDDIVEFDVTDYDKEKRTKIHNFVKLTYGKKVVATTFDRDDRKYIKVFKYTKELVRERSNRWLRKYQYTHFILHKENIDTIQATIMLAAKTATNPGRFVYAGTKDKRAKTSQWICAKKLEPYRIVNAIKHIRNAGGIHVGNFCFREYPLSLGDSKGNVFKIALKDVKGNQEMIEKSLENLKEQGFINYYGLQRFGNCADVPTFRVGIELLKNEYKAACDLILKQRDGEPWYMKEMRKMWAETGSPKLALSRLQTSNNCIEAQILREFVKNPNDYCGALNRVPRNMRLLYTHSYQSYIWNQVVSKRVQKFGLKLIEGDLVYADKNLSHEVEIKSAELPDEDGEKENKGSECSDNEEDDAKDEKSEEKKEVSENTPKIPETSEKTDVPQDLESSASQKTEDTPTSPLKETEKFYKSEKSVPTNFKALVRPLTKEDIESGEYTIYDLVYPLPGHDITYPSNEVSEYYTEFMEKDGITFEDFKNKQRLYSLTGAYRKVFVKPENFTWRFKKHNNLEDSLILSDVEKLEGKEEPEDVPDGKLTALILVFQLPSSVYATMLLREVMKVDTSVDTQLNLTEEAGISVNSGKTEEIPEVSVKIEEETAEASVKTKEAEKSSIVPDSNGSKHAIDESADEVPAKKAKIDEEIA